MLFGRKAADGLSDMWHLSCTGQHAFTTICVQPLMTLLKIAQKLQSDCALETPFLDNAAVLILSMCQSHILSDHNQGLLRGLLHVNKDNDTMCCTKPSSTPSQLLCAGHEISARLPPCQHGLDGILKLVEDCKVISNS